MSIAKIIAPVTGEKRDELICTEHAIRRDNDRISDFDDALGEIKMNSLFRIRLELARTDGFPEGSSEHGYIFAAPLNEDGNIDAEAWRGLKDRCRVTRFWGQDPVQHGLLRHMGRGWRFDYRADLRDDDEPLFKLDKHRIEPGAYLSITEQDGIQRPFRVISVEHLRLAEPVR